MKEIKAFRNALHQASHETTHFMTAHLRSEAHASGWPTNVTRGLHVKYGEDGYQAHVHDSHTETAHNLEYGTPDTQPTAAVRRYANRTHEAEKFLVGRMSKILGDL